MFHFTLNRCYSLMWNSPGLQGGLYQFTGDVVRNGISINYRIFINATILLFRKPFTFLGAVLK